jgi:hypothetical protein
MPSLPRRKYFMKDENTIVDALYHNYVHRLPVNMNPGVCMCMPQPDVLLAERRHNLKALSQELIETRTIAANASVKASALKKKDVSSLITQKH